MKLTTMTQVTVDGVMQGNGAASEEDRREGFERGGWAMGVFDDDTFAFISETYQRADAFLFGRRTYELFAGYWGVRDDLEHPIVGVEHEAQVRRIENAHQPAMGGHDRSLQ
jgi:dihydrofolate reductase